MGFLLPNLLYFNKVFHAFDGIDTDGDKRLDFDEFRKGLHFVGLVLTKKEAQAEFEKIDKNGGGIVLFDEFCTWAAEQEVPVDDEIVRDFTVATDRGDDSAKKTSKKKDADP